MCKERREGGGGGDRPVGSNGVKLGARSVSLMDQSFPLLLFQRLATCTLSTVIINNLIVSFKALG